MSNFLIIGSDCHSDPIAFETLTNLASEKDCLSLIYCGDLNIENWEIGEKLRNRNFSFLPVIGNCDSPWAWRDVGIQTPPLYRTTEFFGLRIFITHGHYGNMPSDFGLENDNFDLIITGHSHIHSLEKKGKQVYLNPGSLAIPRGYSHSSYSKITFEDSALIQIIGELENKVISEIIIPLNK